MSGSLDPDTLAALWSEVRDIALEIEPERVIVLQADTAVRDTAQYAADDLPNEIVVRGRGGTIQSPMGTRPESSRFTDEDSLVAQRLDGKSYVITARHMHGPMSVSFNTGYIGKPTAEENTSVSRKWSDLQLMQVGHPGIVRVGLPDTLIELRKSGT